MDNQIDNRTEIAGLPIAVLHQFFCNTFEPFSIATLVSKLQLIEGSAIAILDELIVNGYLTIDEGHGLRKASKALSLTRLTGFPGITLAAGYKVVSSVLKKVGWLTTRGDTAHVVSGVRVIGDLLTDAVDEVYFAEMEIRIAPRAGDADATQIQLEKSVAESAYEQGEIPLPDRNDRKRSIDYIRDQLLSVHPHAVLRFTV
jgi:hypothetical protein